MGLNGHSLVDDLEDALIRQLVIEVLVEEAGEVGVHTLITRDKLIREGETRHQTTLLEPEDSAEATGEEDALDGGEGNKALSEAVR